LTTKYLFEKEEYYDLLNHDFAYFFVDTEELALIPALDIPLNTQ